MAQNKGMSRPRMTAPVRRGLLKIQRAAMTDRPIIMDAEVSKAITWLDTTCHHWDDFAKKSTRLAPQDEYVHTQSGYVKRPKKAKGKRRRRTPDVSFDIK